MEDRLDRLIADRAPWLFAQRPGAAPLRRAMMSLLGYPRTVELAERFRPLPSDAIMDSMAAMLARDVIVDGLQHVPRSGPALIVSTHPTGIADGIMLHHALRARRPDLYFFANQDILRLLPQMQDMICPVEWRQDRRSHAKTRATMTYVRRAADAGRLGVIFPSGRLAQRRGMTLVERPWMASAAMIARRFDLPVVPVHIAACNSMLFYLFDRIHPTLRDITLFHETLNKAHQPFRITLGAPIPPAHVPARSPDGIALLRRAALALGPAPSIGPRLGSTKPPRAAPGAQDWPRPQASG